MSEWYYLENSEQRGPVAKGDLVQLFRSGRLGPDTLVWTEQLGDWTPAMAIDDLVPPQIAPPPRPIDGRQTTPQANGADSEPMFLYIPVARLVVMAIVSWGLYEAYWIYKNWRYLKERDGLKIWPFWRGIFGVFFCHSLLKKIHNDEQANSVRPAQFPASGLATGWVILMVVGNLLGRVDDPGANLLGLIVSFPTFLFFIPVQRYINDVNQTDQLTRPYSKWSAGHVVCLAVGLLVWLLMLASLSAGA